MAAIPPSGKTFPTPLASTYLKVIIDLLGPNGVDAVLRRAGLDAWIGTPPGVPAGQAVDIAEIASLLAALEETLGRGSLGSSAAWSIARTSSVGPWRDARSGTQGFARAPAAIRHARLGTNGGSDDGGRRDRPGAARRRRLPARELRLLLGAHVRWAGLCFGRRLARGGG
jgi:hypothetical protein